MAIKCKTMRFYFYNKFDDCVTFSTIEECRRAAINDGSVRKFRDNQGGEYFI